MTLILQWPRSWHYFCFTNKQSEEQQFDFVMSLRWDKMENVSSSGKKVVDIKNFPENM